MNQHSLKVLEFAKVKSLIEGRCLTPYGVKEVGKIRPLRDRETIERKQQEISQLRDIIKFGDPFPLTRLDDSLELLSRAKVADIILEPGEILGVLSLVKASMEMVRYGKDDRSNFPLIAEYLEGIRAFPELRAEIEKAIDENGEIKDSASKKLKEIRQDLGASKQRIINRLQSIVAKQSHQIGWQDDIVTLRNDRYVIGIPTHQYRSDMGILHDRSQTGATLFVEPNETVELNNHINMLYQEERQEMARILKVITAEIGSRSDVLMQNCHLIGKLDAIHACADFSIRINGSRPTVTDEPEFELIKVRHPLLMVQLGDPGKVVPNSISLNDTRRAILITGPNTGGKTVLLKTVGLTVLMAQSGMHVAADEASRIGIFADVFADIGDEQSIEQSLSTFSSHVRNIIGGLNGAAADVLLLFDEIGAGTDPKEGSALAEATILYALERGARLIVTTHYSQLKTLAMEYPQIENASFQFDRETLAPTFELKLGLPGSSYAVEIAGRLGMPVDVCRKATTLLGSTEKSLDALIASLEQELKELKVSEAERAEKLKAARDLEQYYRKQTEHLDKEFEAEKQKALSETVGFLDETRRDIERLVAEIRKSRASDESVKQFHARLKKSEQALKKLIEESKPRQRDLSDFRKGDAVEIISLGKQGEIDRLVGKDKAKIKVGNVFTTVELRNLRLLEKAGPPRKAAPSGVSYDRGETAPDREIHLRGMTGDEAIEELDRFLDRSVVHGLAQVYVVHGKGTGALRRKLTDYLKNHPEVASVRLGNWNEGGAGVTVVKLKE
ncbi:MAG: endonuclease MutS2 [Candidatus Zixiibacteriota bacterium]|nr:MAG: endonuclease MutS2 [candidate division Zixibacteria bacterium]